MERPRNNILARQMNRFDDLPDELLICILNKIDDLKSLCWCTIVSKRFTSNVKHVQSVTVRLPGIDVNSLTEDSDPCRLFCHIGDNGEQETFHFIEQQSIHLKLRFLKFLEDFIQLESVTLEFACPRTPCTTSLLKWTLKFLRGTAADSGAMVEGLVSLLPTSILKEFDQDEDEEEEDVEQHTHVDLFDFLKSRGGENSLLFPLLCCCEWLVVVTTLIKRLRSIRRVTCMDAEKHGSFKLEDDQLAGWRRRLVGDQRGFDTKPRKISIGWVPDLRLPESGIRMKGVFCVFMDFRVELNLDYDEADVDYDEADVDYDEADFDDDEADPDFFKTLEYDDGEEKVMGEAVKEIVDKHWNMVKSFITLP